LIGGEEEIRMPKIGEQVMYHQSNPLEDGLLPHPAIVTKVNGNGSVSIQVFLETHIAPMSKIPLAKKPEAGYYTFG